MVEATESARRRRIKLALIVMAVLLVNGLVLPLEQKQADDVERVALRALARSSVQHAIRYLEAGETHRALAYLARALRVDADSAPARNMISDLLLRRSWPIHRQLLHPSFAQSAVFSPDGQQVVSTTLSDDTAQVWDAKTGQLLGETANREHDMNSASLSPDGRWVVKTSGETARIWDLEKGEPVGKPIPHAPYCFPAALSFNGRRVVTAFDDSTAQIWEAETGQPLGEPLRHKDRINSATFSPDGSRVVTASYDGTAQVWDAKTGQPLGEPLHHPFNNYSGLRSSFIDHDEVIVYSAAFSPDGRRVVTASDDDLVRVWEVEMRNSLSMPLRHPDVTSPLAKDDTCLRWYTKSAINISGLT